MVESSKWLSWDMINEPCGAFPPNLYGFRLNPKVKKKILVKSQSLVENKIQQVIWSHHSLVLHINTSLGLNKKQDLSSTPPDYKLGALITPLQLLWMQGLRFYVLESFRTEFTANL